ncbi:hypothetical protein [Streptomyces sp. NPDC001404]|uniref:hypothetical protein n=1 Tax=Streptomyces sp. NPDC001404 TaxID=3364571 RepID=UPI0036A67BAD
MTTVVGIAAPAAQAAPSPASLDLLRMAGASHTTTAAGAVGGSEALMGRPIRVTLPNGQQAMGYRIPIPGSKVTSGFVALTDRYALRANKGVLPVERGGAAWGEAEAFVRRVEAHIAKIASKPNGLRWLEGMSLMRPLDVAVDPGKSATGLPDVGAIFHRELPPDPEQWPDDLKNRWKDAKKDDDRQRKNGQLREDEPGAADFMRTELSGGEPMASPYVRERALDGVGTQGLVSMPEQEVVFFGFKANGERVAQSEAQLVAHELTHVAHYQQGALYPDEKLPVKVEFPGADGSRKTAEVPTAGEEVVTKGGKDRQLYPAYVAENRDGPTLGLLPFERSDDAVKQKIAELRQAEQDGKKVDWKPVLETQQGRHDTFDMEEDLAAEEHGWSMRDHYALPSDMAKGKGITVEELGGTFHTVRPGTKFDDAELKDPDRLERKLLGVPEPEPVKKKGWFAQACSLVKGHAMVCRPDGSPDEVSGETRRRIEKVERFVKEHPDAQVRLPSADAVADRTKVRAEAVEAGRKLPGRARERAKELCAKSGQASCLETVDWKKVREQARAEAERLTELKLAGMENITEARLVTDLKTVVEDPSAFYVPYDKTRAQLGGERINWGNVVTHTGGAVLWGAGVAVAFSRESTDLDKTAAVAALVPLVGSALQVAVDFQDKDFAGVGVDGLAALMEGLEIFGVTSGAAGPAFAVALAYHLTKSWTDHINASYEEMRGLPAERDKQWKKLLNQYLQDDKQGWLAKRGGTEAVAAGIGLVQAAEMQRAAVKGLAHAASTATGSGTVNSVETGSRKWSDSQQFKDADAKVDDLTDNTPKLVRSALAKALKKGFDGAWTEKTGQDFNQQFIGKANSFTTSTWCAPDIGNHGGGGRYAQCLSTMRGEQRDVVEKLKSNAPAGMSVAEIEDVLEAMGMSDPGFLQPVNTPHHLQLATGETGWYLSVAADGGAVEHRASLDRPDLQTFVFHPTGRISTLDGERCLVGGDSEGAAVSTGDCANLQKQRWRPDGDGRLVNVATGLLLGTRPADSEATAGRVVMVADNEQAAGSARWKAVAPKRDAHPQKDSPALAGLLAAEGASGRVDAVMPASGLDREYWVFSGSQYQRIRLDDPDGTTVAGTVTGAGKPAAITDNWPSLAALLADSKAGRVDAAMPVPGSDRRFYVFSGDKYARIGIDDNLKDDNESHGSRGLDQWASLKGLFGKSGVTRVDAVRPVAGNPNEYQVFSGAWFATIHVDGDDSHNDTQVVAPRRIADGWPVLALNTGTDQIQALLPVPGTDADYYVFTNGNYTRVNGQGLRLPAPANVTAEVHKPFDGFGNGYVSWGNAPVPAGAQVVIRGSGYQERVFPYAKRQSDRIGVPFTLTGITTDYAVFYRYTHPDGVVEESPQVMVRMWCSTFECGVN